MTRASPLLCAFGLLVAGLVAVGFRTASADDERGRKQTDDKAPQLPRPFATPSVTKHPKTVGLA
jgi:hypothetical protein